MLSRFLEAVKPGLASVVVLMLVGAQAQVEAGQRWIAPAEVRNVLGNGGNYGVYNTTDQYLLWDSGGKALDTTLRAKATGTAVEFKLTGKASGTNVPDGALNECVAFVRGATGAPGSG